MALNEYDNSQHYDDQRAKLDALDESEAIDYSADDVSEFHKHCPPPADPEVRDPRSFADYSQLRMKADGLPIPVYTSEQRAAFDADIKEGLWDDYCAICGDVDGECVHEASSPVDWRTPLVDGAGKRIYNAALPYRKTIGLYFVQDVESIAKVLHEAGREAVEKGLVVNKVPGQPFFSWEELTEVAREGRRIMARYLLDRFHLTPRTVTDSSR